MEDADYIREIERLRMLVMRAFNEGFRASKEYRSAADAWNNSTVRERLDPNEEVELDI